MKKENDKFVILMQQNLGKSHFCRQVGCLHAPCHMLSDQCVVNNIGISSIKIDKLSQGCRTRGKSWRLVLLPLA